MGHRVGIVVFIIQMFRYDSSDSIAHQNHQIDNYMLLYSSWKGLYLRQSLTGNPSPYY